VYEQHDDATEIWYSQISNNQWVNVYKYLTAKKHNRYLWRMLEIVFMPKMLQAGSRKCILEI
jgi:hypothetical protein